MAGRNAQRRGGPGHIRRGLVGALDAQSVDHPEADVVDVESFAKSGERVPPGRRYRIRVDRDFFVTAEAVLTGREILHLAGRLPVERFRLDQQFPGGATSKVALDESVDLTAAGIERFRTLPLDQTEGVE